MKTFKDIEQGDKVYFAAVINSELMDGKIDSKEVDEVRNYYSTDCKELQFSDNTMIIPRNSDYYYIKNPAGCEDATKPLNFILYAADYDTCLDVLKKIVSKKFTEINNVYKDVNAQISRICLIYSDVRKIVEAEHKKKEVVLETVFVD